MRFSLTVIFACAALAVAQTQIPDSEGPANVGKGNGKQFITGRCASNADCNSKCCADVSESLGLCSAESQAEVGKKKGCGFKAKDSDVEAATKGQNNRRGFIKVVRKDVHQEQDE
ncbi:hypothetical protein BU24DRAFT_473782 [Aaosphaeria arxii CBS 175.79]|uniref:Biotrophy-associated secreted protein 2 n=1 Tax=Aaosphaeria arxii CBS 175.79 TaxID=1450172 RepID=A0A6A5X9Q4_9PLEO|nr:uncharacterized protein BU24DRAFT_473782 [Aaosphaeria arxii CBS 175.79]KAF2009596.1 hypothetical protein BU24DRAFT_473782 [Aaosphaeria arxii CBS 175.79]